jgi:hypothetical protein
MSSMDPHMISGTWDGLWLSLWLGCGEVGLLDRGSVMVRVCDAIETVTSEEMSLLSCLHVRLILSPLLSTCQPRV